MLCRDPDKSHKLCIGDCAERRKRTGVIMNDCKWTAGPWVACPAGDIWSENLNCKVADAFVPVKQNAHLIAAAPTMATFIQGLINDGLLGIGWREEAEEIMAKARGEQV